MARALLFQAPQEPIADPNTGMISRTWYLWFMQLIQEFTTAGDVFGPSSALDDQIVLFSGTTGKLIKGATGTGFVFATNGIYSVTSATTAMSGGEQLHGLQRVLGDGATTAFDLLDIAEYLEHVGVGGSFRDPATFALSADRSQIVFAAAPTAGDVIAIEYVTATI
jgi:hypothetical protein